MSIDPISGNSVAATPANINPQAKTEQATATAQVSQDTQKSAKAAKTDTVTISQQALQKTQQLASDGDTMAQEAKESAAEKASETLRDKK
ncbi:hypothetical protein GMSM_19100 [Geomonas sp. Red276]